MSYIVFSNTLVKPGPKGFETEPMKKVTLLRCETKSEAVANCRIWNNDRSMRNMSLKAEYEEVF